MFHATTILGVKKDDRVAVAGDGQVTFGDSTIIKHGARKVRRLYNGQVITGFAGSAADSLTLCEKFEGKLESYQGNLMRAAVELAKEWRTDRVLRKLEALLIAANSDGLLMISGTGEVIEPDDGIAAVGSGAPYALAAARALLRNTDLSPGKIAGDALKIASEICVYTNDHIIVEEL
ncbi:MAG: ATP-dependent protease subunit HslV [Dethiobacteria bacterium]|nr:ATP-dependent protease subunit HslV [Bacillota bacterium]MDW7728664.1 ATP-dependent protease subunit HslV [Bacillota bacterium]